MTGGGSTLELACGGVERAGVGGELEISRHSLRRGAPIGRQGLVAVTRGPAGPPLTRWPACRSCCPQGWPRPAERGPATRLAEARKSAPRASPTPPGPTCWFYSMDSGQLHSSCTGCRRAVLAPDGLGPAGPGGAGFSRCRGAARRGRGGPRTSASGLGREARVIADRGIR